MGIQLELIQTNRAGERKKLNTLYTGQKTVKINLNVR